MTKTLMRLCPFCKVYDSSKNSSDSTLVKACDTLAFAVFHKIVNDSNRRRLAVKVITALKKQRGGTPEYEISHKQAQHAFHQKSCLYK